VDDEERIFEAAEMRGKGRIGRERLPLRDDDLGTLAELAKGSVNEPGAASLPDLENGSRRDGLRSIREGCGRIAEELAARHFDRLAGCGDHPLDQRASVRVG